MQSVISLSTTSLPIVTLGQVARVSTERRRVRLYARKLAEIEQFLERQLALPEETDPPIRIHEYWTA